MALYNSKTEGHSLRVTKFDSDLNPESSYLTTLTECTCPAGSRRTCRHRKMYNMLIPIADTHKFLDFENTEYRTYGDSDDVDDGDHRFNKEDYA